MKLRSNVAAIVFKEPGLLLICERNDYESAWQFPQGGVRKDETLEEALIRELREEIGIEPDLYVIRDCKGPYEYRFANGKIKRGYSGQSQHYFLVDFQGCDQDINVQTEEPEFRSFRWIKPTQFELQWLPAFKRDVYRSVLWDFFGVKR